MSKILPIDVVPGTNPPRFKWRRSVNTMVGKKTVDCDGALPPQVEDSVRDVIALVKDQEREIDRLREQVAALQKQIEGHVERIAQQSELLNKRAEKVAHSEPPTPLPQMPNTKGGRKGS